MDDSLYVLLWVCYDPSLLDMKIFQDSECFQVSQAQTDGRWTDLLKCSNALVFQCLLRPYCIMR
jgi:hypothetical protein